MYICLAIMEQISQQSSLEHPEPLVKTGMHPFLTVYLGAFLIAFIAIASFLPSVFFSEKSDFRTVLGSRYIDFYYGWFLLSPFALLAIGYIFKRESNRFFLPYKRYISLSEAFFHELVTRKIYIYYFTLLVLYLVAQCFVLIWGPIQVSNGTISQTGFSSWWIILLVNNLFFLILTILTFSLTNQSAAPDDTQAT